MSSSGGAACFKEKGRGKQEKALGANKRKRTDMKERGKEERQADEWKERRAERYFSVNLMVLSLRYFGAQKTSDCPVWFMSPQFKKSQN